MAAYLSRLCLALLLPISTSQIVAGAIAHALAAAVGSATAIVWPLSCLPLLGCWAIVVLILSSCSLPSGCPLAWSVMRWSPSLQDVQVYNLKISWLVKRNTKKEKKNLMGAQTTLFGPHSRFSLFLHSVSHYPILGVMCVVFGGRFVVVYKLQKMNTSVA